MAAITTSRFAGQQLSKRFRDLATCVKTALDAPDPEAVHALRISIRHLQPVVDVFEPCFSAKHVKKLRRRLKGVLTLAGQVRNYDVALKLLSELRFRGIGKLRTTLNAQREEAAGQLRSELETGWNLELVPVHAHRKFFRQSVRTTARRQLVRMAKDFFRSGDQAVASSGTSARRLHRLRMAAKQLHYTIQLFASLLGPPARGMLLKIHEAQSLLGAVSNHRAARDTVAGLDQDGSVEEYLKKEQRQKMKKFRRAWKDEFSGNLVNQWVDVFRK